jgi:hypothetical protein
LPLFIFFAEAAIDRLRFMDEQHRLSPPQDPGDAKPVRRNTMKASKLFIAIAAVAVSGSVFAAGIPAANAAATTAAATAQVTVAAQSVSVSVPAPTAKTSRTREEVRAEAVEAVKNHRATEASQFDWITR